MLDFVAVKMPPSISESSLQKRRKTYDSRIIEYSVCWCDSSIEIAHKEERFIGSESADLNNGIEKVSHVGRLRWNMYDAEGESVRRNRDLKPQAGIIQRGYLGEPSGDRRFRQNTNGVVETVRGRANLMLETQIPERLRERPRRTRDELDQRNNIGTVAFDAVGNVLAAFFAALLNVPDEKFHEY